MNKYLRRDLYVGLVALMMAGAGAFASANNNVSASGYLTNSISRARRSRDYVIHSMNLERLSNSNYFAGIRSTGKARIYRGEKIGVVPFYHMGHDGFVVSIPGKRGIYYAPTNSHNWFGQSYRLTKHRVRAKKSGRKAVRKSHRFKTKRTKRVKRYNRKVRVNHKRAKRQRKADGFRVLKSHFKRSNNRRLLERSGFKDAQNDAKQLYGANFIFNKYAPNDKRAVVPKNFRGKNWYQGYVGQKDPRGYVYLNMFHGWYEFR